MSAFIFVHSKVGGPNWTKENLDQYLPRPSEELKIYSKGQCYLYHLAFNTALFREVFQDKNFTAAIEGYISNDNLKRIPDFLLSPSGFDVSSFPDAFCALSFSERRFGFYSSITGVDQLFYYEDDTGFYVTNRHNLLGMACKSLSLREDSFAWICSRGHIGDHGSYWNEIKRTKPGVKYFFDGGLSCITGCKQGLFEEIKDADAADYFRSVADDFGSIMGGVDASKSLSLTGGKDSRAILGLLDYTNSLGGLRVNTTGSLYSPDVMAAKRLTEKLNIKNHNITRPKLVSTAEDYAERIANDLLFDFLGKSLADMSKFSFTKNLVLGGLDTGIKASKNKKSLEEFIKSRKYYCDSQSILTEEKRSQIMGAYSKALRESFSNVPIDCYDQVEHIDCRASNRNSPNITGSHIGSSQLHPLYDGRIIKGICGLSDGLLSSHFIPYFFTNISNVDLVNEPFANDGWPNGLAEIVNKSDGVRKIKNTTPFGFLKEFPSEKAFGLFSWRLDLCDMSQQRLVEYISGNKEFFSFLEFDKALDIVRKSGSKKSFREMQIHLGLLKAALLHFLGSKIFAYGNKDLIIKGVKEFLQGEPGGVSNDFDIEEKLEEKLLDYEVAIANLAGRIRALKASPEQLNKQNNGKEKISMVLDKQPEMLGRIKAEKKYIVTGTSDLVLENKQILIFFKATPESNFPGFNYSKSLEGFFKYLSVDNGFFKTEFVIHDNSREFVDVFISLWNFKNTNLPVELEVFVE